MCMSKELGNWKFMRGLARYPAGPLDKGELRLRIVWLFFAVVLFSGVLSSALAEDIVSLSKEEWNKLDTFEAHTLAKADQTFGKKQWMQAAAEYDSFILEFPNSKAIPYAVLKKGLCMQFDDKRFKAIEEYNEVLDYFPNAITFAAPALYFMGECHWDNGDADKAIKAWTEMANDEDYSKHAFAAYAVNKLADNLMKQEKEPEAVKYYEQVAVDFRRSNHDAAHHAMAPVIRYYIRTNPNEPKLREFYKKVESFEHAVQKLPEDVIEDRLYWQRVWEKVWEYGEFATLKNDLKTRYFSYWAGIFQGKFPEWDDFQINLAGFRLSIDGDNVKWAADLDKQFQQYHKPDDYDRIIKWVKAFHAHPKKVEEYYQKIDFSKITYKHVLDLISILYDQAKQQEMARNAISKVRFDKLTDDEKARLAYELYNRDGNMVKEVCMYLQDKDRGKAELLAYCYWARYNGRYLSPELMTQCIPLADHLITVEKYAKGAWYKKGEFLRWDKKFQEAIAAYRSADNPPQNLWRIVDCHIAMGKVSEAVEQLVEIENFFKSESSKAALCIAYVYRDAGDKNKYISELRAVLKKYPGSGESSTAHQELEKMGFKIGGGIDAE